MSLVLRKGLLTRNSALLRCIKGRNIAASTANKKGLSPCATAACARIPMRYSTKLHNAPTYIRADHIRTPGDTARRHYSMFKSLSCPCFARNTCQYIIPMKARTASATDHLSRKYSDKSKKDKVSPTSTTKATEKKPSEGDKTDKLSENLKKLCDACGSTLPCTCCPNPCLISPACQCYGNKLPPPCPDAAPKCIQYMTGYYYYPYGFWFCGPYNQCKLCEVSPSCTPPCPPPTCGCCPTPSPPCCPVCPSCAVMPNLPETASQPQHKSVNTDMPKEYAGKPDINVTTPQGTTPFGLFGPSSCVVAAPCVPKPMHQSPYKRPISKPKSAWQPHKHYSLQRKQFHPESFIKGHVKMTEALDSPLAKTYISTSMASRNGTDAVKGTRDTCDTLC